MSCWLVCRLWHFPVLLHNFSVSHFGGCSRCAAACKYFQQEIRFLPHSTDCGKDLHEGKNGCTRVQKPTVAKICKKEKNGCTRVPPEITNGPNALPVLTIHLPVKSNLDWHLYQLWSLGFVFVTKYTSLENKCFLTFLLQSSGIVHYTQFSEFGMDYRNDFGLDFFI